MSHMLPRKTQKIGGKMVRFGKTWKDKRKFEGKVPVKKGQKK